MQKTALEQKLALLPDSSGVYQYFDENHKLLYIGKAKNLKKRVKSYFVNKTDPNPKNSLRIQNMISQTYHLNYIKTNSEEDALILENSLIKQLNPKYNILLRDDKTYPYIVVDFNDDFPRLKITRKIEKKEGIKYFGPFVNGAKALLDSIYLVYNLRQKESCKKKCLFYQLKRCFAPCENEISKQDYKQILDKACLSIQDHKELLNALNSKMVFHAEHENYEQAMVFRDNIKAIQNLKLDINIDLAKDERFDICVLHLEGKKASAVRMVIDNGKVISVIDKKILNTKECEFDEIYKSVILDFYKDFVNTNEIYLNDSFLDMDIISNALSEKFKTKISFKVPKIGSKKRLVELCINNAKMLLEEKNELKLDDDFIKMLGLDFMPNKIEVFDNSHMQGKANVGAMIVWQNTPSGGEFDKSLYRMYHLNSKNDYMQMSEVLTRRIKDFEKENAPDLWLIDGGNALVNLAKDLLSSYGANVKVLGIAKQKVDFKAYRAKGGADDIIYNEDESFKLGKDNKNLQFFQKLRDEAHRFAIKFHRQTKQKEDISSGKLESLGISKAKIVKLINYFGSFENIYSAKDEELEKLVGAKTKDIIKNNLSNF